MLQQTFFPNRNNKNNSGNGWGILLVSLILAGTTGYIIYKMNKPATLRPQPEQDTLPQ